MNSRKIKKNILEILAIKEYPEFLDDILKYPPKKALGALFSAINNKNEKVKWHAVTCFGALLKILCAEDPEYGRVFIRRLIWMLSDESGGIGWGVPEVMGEVLSEVDYLAEEFSTILIYQIIDLPGRPDVFLEHKLLRRGGYWAVARFSKNHPLIVKTYINDILNAYIKETDPYIQLMGLLIFKLTGFSWPGVKEFLNKNQKIKIYWDCKFQEITIKDMARELI
ncbi:DVU0298 family protein [Desulfothermus sp.]